MGIAPPMELHVLYSVAVLSAMEDKVVTANDSVGESRGEGLSFSVF